MDRQTAIDRASQGLAGLQKQKPKVEERENYVRGKQRLPWAPPGIGEEHEELRKQAPANWLGLAVFSPIQRLDVDAIYTNDGKEQDDKAWKVWKANKLGARQTVVYESMMTHGRGIVSCWPNEKNKARPVIRPQAYGSIWIEPDPDDPFEIGWAVKIKETKADRPNGLIVPDSARPDAVIAWVYDDESWVKLKSINRGAWTVEDGGENPLGESPFVTYDYRPDANGTVWSAVDPLIPQQDGINTIRFNMLLAMQYSAYRQRVVTGFDPVARDGSGQVIYRKNPDGSLMTDRQGRNVPVLNEIGRAAVDRLLVFNGDQTKVFDMPESNLANYVTMLTEFLTQFFATAQIPPQYLLSRMANLSGDAMAGAESTFTSLQGELRRYANEGHEELMKKAFRAAGEPVPDDDLEMHYADVEVKSFSQIVDGIQKLITADFPRKGAFEMLPNSSPAMVERWLQQADDEAEDSLIQLAKQEMELSGRTPNPAPNGSDALQPAAPAGAENAPRGS